jgi:hypothetical protein
MKAKKTSTEQLFDNRRYFCLSLDVNEILSELAEFRQKAKPGPDQAPRAKQVKSGAMFPAAKRIPSDGARS